MPSNNLIDNAFDEWFNEMVGFSFRSEHFYGDIEYEDVLCRNINARQWLKTAFEMGYNAGVSSNGEPK